MGGYEGQPEYVRIGFQRDLLAQWIAEQRVLPNDGWGREVDAMFSLVDAAVSCSDHDRAAVVLPWIWEEMGRWHEEDWYEEWDPEDFDAYRLIRSAQGAYEGVVAYWRDRAKGFNGNVSGTESVASDALEEVIAGLPDWVKPDPNAPSPPDPERKEYERLKAKFGS